MGVEYQNPEAEETPQYHRNDVTDPSSKPMTTLIFTYGTLKRGFSNHALMQDLIRTGDASFRGTHRTTEPYPLVCGPYRVPFLLNLPGASGAQRVTGELYAVTPKGLAKLDELEGTGRGHYERLPMKVEWEGAVKEAEAYFGHRSYAGEMWKSIGRRGYGVYGEKESKGYIRRKDRPEGVTFLEQIQDFISSSNATN